MMTASTSTPSGIDDADGADRPTSEIRTRVAAIFDSPRFMTSLVVVGIALRFWAYVRDTSLYLDEILLSRNILELPLRELMTRPLQLDQVAPRGFLFVEKLAVMLLGQGEHVLRLFPFLCAAASVILFRRLAERLLTGFGPAVALFLFAIGVPFLRFGADVKQYSSDLTVGILLWMLALDVSERSSSTLRLGVIGLAGFVIGWFSQASVLVMAGIGAALAVDLMLSRNPQRARALLITIPLWAVASLVAIVVGFRSMTPSTREFMNDFWAGGFFPLPMRWSTGSRWLWDQMNSLFSDPFLLRYRWPALFVLIALLGAVVLWRRSRGAAFLLLGPFAMCLGAAVAHQYPFRGRLVFWMLAPTLLFVAAGIEWLRTKASVLHPILGLVLLLAALAPPVMAFAEAPPPYEIEHHWELLGYLQQHREPGDKVYVLRMQHIGVQFYGSRYGLLPSEWTTDICDRDLIRPYIKDADRFHGVPRLWVLAGSGRPFAPMHAAVRRYLGTIGVKKDSFYLPSLTLGSVGIELYDLSDPNRLSAASAETFPVSGAHFDPRPGCRDWAEPNAPSELRH